MTPVKQLRVENSAEYVQYTFVPPLTLEETVSMPLPADRPDYTLNEFPRYGNRGVRIKHEVFGSKTETQEMYTQRLAKHIGECLIVPDLRLVG